MQHNSSRFEAVEILYAICVFCQSMHFTKRAFLERLQNRYGYFSESKLEKFIGILKIEFEIPIKNKPTFLNSDLICFTKRDLRHKHEKMFLRCYSLTKEVNIKELFAERLFTTSFKDVY